MIMLIDYGVLTTFNVKDLIPYLEDCKELDLKANPSQPKEDDKIMIVD